MYPKVQNIILISILILYVSVVLIAFMQPAHRELILTEREQTVIRNAIYKNEEGEICVHANHLNVNSQTSRALQYEDESMEGIHIDGNGTLQKFTPDHTLQPLYVFYSYNNKLNIQDSFQDIYLESGRNADIENAQDYKPQFSLVYEDETEIEFDISFPTQRFVASRFNDRFLCTIQSLNDPDQVIGNTTTTKKLERIETLGNTENTYHFKVVSYNNTTKLSSSLFPPSREND
jgi:hypothetical protein